MRWGVQHTEWLAGAIPHHLRDWAATQSVGRESETQEFRGTNLFLSWFLYVWIWRQVV
jgi:hypothetical protein